MANHDHSYKLLFSHPKMVRDLLEGFVGGPWLDELDFSTLERVSDSYVSDDLRARADDVVWRIRCGQDHVYLLVEFQSTVEPFMAVRVLTYVGLLYQDLVRKKESSSCGRLPAILPIVLHSGSRRWRAAEELAALLDDAPRGIEQYRPQLRYLLIDEGGFDDGELSRQRNLVALLFRIESCRQRSRLEYLVGMLVKWLHGPEHESLRRAFAVWLEKVILARLPDTGAGAVLWERPTMLSEWLDEWGEEMRREARQKGEANLLSRMLQKRFGELPEWVGEHLRNASPDQLEQWGERLMDVTSLRDLFNGDPAIEPASGMNRPS
ncbi:MAG: Rpn family recombination-promoting nuclease/putative transposase [Gammaproteobacteria bacterium]